MSREKPTLSNSREWLWLKSRREAFQEVLFLIDPGGEWDDGS